MLEVVLSAIRLCFPDTIILKLLKIFGENFLKQLKRGFMNVTKGVLYTHVKQRTEYMMSIMIKTSFL